MVKTLTQYRVFIASPGGLEPERRCFRDKLDKFTVHHAECRDVVFHPVGWEEALGSAGRPQALINKDLEQCDYAVFVLHDRWGSPTGSGHTSGTEEEWIIAEDLYKASKIRNIALFFKSVDPGKLRDPGLQLSKVLEFKKRIEDEKRYLFRQFETIDMFGETIEAHLARWLRDHEGQGAAIERLSLGHSPSSIAVSPSTPSGASGPGYQYWIDEAIRLVNETPPDGAGCLFCADRAILLAPDAVENARARSIKGSGHLAQGATDLALSVYDSIFHDLRSATEPALRVQFAKALFNKGVTLGTLGRGVDAAAVFDEVIARFGAASELELRQPVAKALVNKGFRLGTLGRGEDAAAVYDEVIARFGAATETELVEIVKQAKLNIGHWTSKPIPPASKKGKTRLTRQS